MNTVETMEVIKINTIGDVEISNIGNKVEVVYLNLDNELITDNFTINNFDIDNDESIKMLENKIIFSDNFVSLY